MQNILQELIFKLLKLGSCPPHKTKKFQELKHDCDLVPRFEEHLNTLRKFYNKYYNDCYDIQGINDKGVDVLFKYLEGKEHYRIGLQVKSFDDINKKDWLSKLKSQILDACSTWDLKDIYIILCTDEKKHKKKLRIGLSEIAKIKCPDPECNIHIVKPAEALFFYNLKDEEILSFVKNENPVFEAKKYLIGLNNEEIRIIIEVATLQLLDKDDNIHSCDISIPDNHELINRLIDPFSPSDFIKYDGEMDLWRYIEDNNIELTCCIIKTGKRLKNKDSVINFLYEQLKNEKNIHA